MTSADSTWAHLAQTGPEALLWLAVAAVSLVGGAVVGDALGWALAWVTKKRVPAGTGTRGSCITSGGER
jgi:hypothetical protein